MNLPTLTHEEEVNLERFANLMIELIERHADVVDKNEMLEKLNKINDARDNNLASFLAKILQKMLYSIIGRKIFDFGVTMMVKKAIRKNFRELKYS